MKRYGNLFDKVVSRDNIFLAFRDAKKNKRNKRSVYQFELNFGKEIDDLWYELHNGSYVPRPYYKFIVKEPKVREIYAPSFRDVVVQHALYRIVYPLFEKGFITQSHGCRKNHGCQSANGYMQDAMRNCDSESYFLQLDIKKYFYSFDRSILRKMLERKIKDRDVVSLLMKFAEYEPARGVPIGNLLSQMYGLIYLDPLDHYIKRKLKVKYYVRYVDDFVLIGLSRDSADKCLIDIKEFIADELGLELSRFTLAKIKRGINFVGFRTWKTHKLVRKYAVIKFRRACKFGRFESLPSMIGHAKDTQTLPHYKKILEENNILEYLPTKIQRKMQ